MAGMLQILTYLLSFYLVIKGIEILMIATASARADRYLMVASGIVVLIACIVAAFAFSTMQNHQAESLSSFTPPSLGGQ